MIPLPLPVPVPLLVPCPLTAARIAGLRATVVAVYVKRMTAREAAVMLGCQESTVRSRVQHVRAALCRALGG